MGQHISSLHFNIYLLYSIQCRSYAVILLISREPNLSFSIACIWWRSAIFNNARIHLIERCVIMMMNVPKKWFFSTSFAQLPQRIYFRWISHSDCDSVLPDRKDSEHFFAERVNAFCHSLDSFGSIYFKLYCNLKTSTISIIYWFCFSAFVFHLIHLSNFICFPLCYPPCALKHHELNLLSCNEQKQWWNVDGENYGINKYWFKFWNCTASHAEHETCSWYFVDVVDLYKMR